MRLLILTCGFFLLSSNGLSQQPDGGSGENQPRTTQILRTYQTIRIETGTWLAKPEMCEGALQKRKEFDAWELSIVRSGRADVVIKIDHQPGWFYYQYSMVHYDSQVVLASGNVTAWDGTVACNMVADAIVERTKRARPLPKRDQDPKHKTK